MRVRLLRIAVLALMLALLLPAAAWADACPAGGEHEWEAALVSQATDDSDGLRRFACVKCGESFDQVIPATGHVWGPWVTDVEPTCTSPGRQHRVCENDAGHREERVLEPLSAAGEHTWVEVSRTPATCEADGEVRLSCSVCGADSSERLPATGHEWGQWQAVRAATVDAEGLERRVCLKNASHVEERAVPVAVGNVSRAEGPSSGTADAPAASATAEDPQPDPWKPNSLDAALLAADAVALGVFAVLAAPLLFAHGWVLARRREVRDAAPSVSGAAEGGRVL